MKISKIKASTSTRTLVGIGKSIPRQDRTSKGFQKAKQRADGGACEGESVRPRIGSVPMRKNGGPLTAKARNALPKKDFALPGGRYPIEDENHARDALSRVSGNGTPEEKSEVRAEVANKYPSIGRKSGGRVKRESGGDVSKYLKRGAVGDELVGAGFGAASGVSALPVLAPKSMSKAADRVGFGTLSALAAGASKAHFDDAKEKRSAADKWDALDLPNRSKKEED
jgi:hypothetical protein